jgi:hypothetical protein
LGKKSINNSSEGGHFFLHTLSTDFSQKRFSKQIFYGLVSLSIPAVGGGLDNCSLFVFGPKSPFISAGRGEKKPQKREKILK